MSKPKNKPNGKLTKQFEQDALLSGNLSSKGVMFSDQGQDNEIQSNSTDSSNTQPSPWQGPKQKSLVISSHVPFTSFHLKSFGLAYCWVHSHTGFKSVTSAKKVSFSAFTLLVSEPITFVTKASCNTFPSLVCVQIALTSKIKTDLDFSDLQSHIFIRVKAYSAFRDLQCQSFNNIISDLDFNDFQHQLFINIEADLNFNQFLSSTLHQTKAFVAMIATETKSKNALFFDFEGEQFGSTTLGWSTQTKMIELIVTLSEGVNAVPTIFCNRSSKFIIALNSEGKMNKADLDS
jgi:hypothetical protein